MNDRKQILLGLVMGIVFCLVIGATTPGLGPETDWIKVFKKTADSAVTARTNIFTDLAPTPGQLYQATNANGSGIFVDPPSVGSSTNGVLALNGNASSNQVITTLATGTDISITTSNGPSGSTNFIEIPTATTARRGALSSNDWQRFDSIVSRALTNGNLGAVNFANGLVVDGNVRIPTGTLAVGDNIYASNFLAVLGELQLPGYPNVNDELDNLQLKVGGPASAVDNTLVRFDSTTGKLIQGSGVVLGDDGAMSGIESISATNNLTIGGSVTANDATFTSFVSAGGSVTATGNIITDGELRLGSKRIKILVGSDSPEGVVSADPQSQYFQTNQTSGIGVWWKTNGTGNTGWWLLTPGSGGSGGGYIASANGRGTNESFYGGTWYHGAISNVAPTPYVFLEGNGSGNAGYYAYNGSGNMLGLDTSLAGLLSTNSSAELWLHGSFGGSTAASAVFSPTGSVIFGHATLQSNLVVSGTQTNMGDIGVQGGVSAQDPSSFYGTVDVYDSLSARQGLIATGQPSSITNLTATGTLTATGRTTNSTTSGGGFWTADVSGFVSLSSPTDYIIMSQPQGGIFGTLDGWILGDGNTASTILSLSTNTSEFPSNLTVSGEMALPLNGTNWVPYIADSGIIRKATLSGLSLSDGVLTVTGGGGGGPGTLPMNANQFDTNSPVTLKNGALVTNLNVRTALTLPTLTASRAALINSSGQLTNGAVTDTELGYLSGVTSAVQTQINARQGGNPVLTNLVGTVANNVTNENSAALQINTGTLTLTPGPLSNIVASGHSAPYIAVNTNSGSLANITNLVFRSGVVLSNDSAGIASIHVAASSGSTNPPVFSTGTLIPTNGVYSGLTNLGTGSATWQLTEHQYAEMVMSGDATLTLGGMGTITNMFGADRIAPWKIKIFHSSGNLTVTGTHSITNVGTNTLASGLVNTLVIEKVGNKWLSYFDSTPTTGNGATFVLNDSPAIYTPTVDGFRVQTYLNTNFAHATTLSIPAVAYGVKAEVTNDVSAAATYTFTTPTIGTSGRMLFRDNGTTKTIGVQAWPAQIRLMSTNNTSSITNILTVASQWMMLNYDVSRGTNSTTNFFMWVTSETGS